jgi:hypothetical protein
MEADPDMAGEPFQEPGGPFQDPGEESQEAGGFFREPGGESPEPGGESQDAGGFFREPGEESPEPGHRRSATGEPRVDAALARLDELAGRPVTEHRAIFEDVHRRLREVLGELDTREPPQPREAGGPASRMGR